MAELKTQPSDRDVDAFLESVPDTHRRADAIKICELMESVTGEPAKMWGDSIVGFGSQHLRYESGRELDWFKVGFSPRKQSLTLYLSGGFEPHAELLSKLGPHSTGKGCLYIKRLDDVDQKVLRRMIKDSIGPALPRS
jgi:Domain of unknown function (DU1801)